MSTYAYTIKFTVKEEDIDSETQKCFCSFYMPILCDQAENRLGTVIYTDGSEIKQYSGVVPDSKNYPNGFYFTLKFTVGEHKIDVGVNTMLENIDVWFPTKCFYHCKQITDIQLNSTVHKNIIGNYAFEGTSITSFTFFKNTVLMDQKESNPNESSWVFARCDQLTGIAVEKDHPYYATDSNGNLYGAVYNFNYETDKDGNTIYKGKEVLGYGLLYYANGQTAKSFTVPEKVSIPLATIDNETGEVVSIEIENREITYIGSSAFCCSHTLTEITLPTSIQYIRPHAFYDCYNLESLNLNEGLLEIGDGAFYQCTQLGAIYPLYIPASVKQIDDRFVYCPNIRFNCNIANETYESHGGSLYQKGRKKLETACNWDGETYSSSFTVPSTVVEIGGWAFNSLSLSHIDLHSGITKIGAGAFFNCTSLKNITLPPLLDTLSDRLFEASALAHITVPFNVKSLGDKAFYNCTSLASVNLSEGLTEIGDSVFWKCAFKSLTIPSTVQTIGISLVQNCTNLKSLTFADIKHSQLLKWEAYGVLGCTALESLEFPPKLEKINGEFAQGCKELAKVIIPESVKIIEHYAFSYCSALTEIVIPKGVETLSRGIFLGCTALKKLTLPFVGEKWVKEKGVVNPEAQTNTENRRSRLEFLFWNYSSHTNVSTLNKRLYKEDLTLGPYYTNLTEVEVTNATEIPVDAFINCTAIRHITLNDGIESIGDTAFCGCDALESVMIGQEAQTIKDASFSACVDKNDKGQVVGGLKSIVVPDNVISIGNNFCSGDGALTKAVIGAKVQEFGNNAFLSCNALKELVFKNPNPAAFYAYSFSKLPQGVESIYVPSESIDEYKAAAKIIDVYNAAQDKSSNFEDKIKAIETIEENYEDYSTNFNTTYYYRSFSKNGDTYEVSPVTSTILPEQFTDIILQDKDILCRLPYNIKLSDYKYVAQESIASTLGGKYPLIRRNGDTYYRQFKLTGMLYVDCEKSGDTRDSRGVILGSWVDPDLPTLYVADSSLIPNEVRGEAQKAALRRSIETQARTLITNFLSNGRPKLFKSQEEGLMIVYLSAVSFTPNASLDRHIYDFSATVTEVCEYNAANVKKYKLISDDGYTAYQVDLEG